MPKTRSASVLVVALLVATCSTAAAAVLPAFEPAASGGLEAVDRALIRLSGHRRLLIVGAHPDDEDNALLAHVSRDLGGEVAYLSLSRGEGGQNLIGPELGIELGVIRSGELVAARLLEGTRQYFTRARDFGYTRSLEETFARWPREELQRDALRVARRFRPQVIVSVFPASERAGHGQHQAAAILASDIYELAGDPRAAPDLALEGLEPWQPAALYRRAWGQQEASVRYELGALDPLSGRSDAQLAAASRSLHRSQDMGREQRIGNYLAGLVWLAGGSGPESEEIFAGIDTALAAIAALVPNQTAAARIEELLRSVERDAAALRDELSPTSLAAAVEPLASMLSRLRQAEDLARQSGADAAAELVGEKQGHLEAALAAAAGVVVDASCDRETLTPGEAGTVELSVWPAGEASVKIRDVQLASAVGWTVAVPERLGVEERSGVEQWRARVSLPVETRPTQPYYLERALVGDLYDWSEVPHELRGQPFQPGPVTAVFDLEVGGADVRLVKEVVHRYGDQAVGEIRRPLRAVPPLEVEVACDLVLWPRERTEPVALEVVLRSSVAEPVAGALDLDLPPGWRVRGERSFEIAEPRGSLAVTLALESEGIATEGRSLVAIGAALDDGTEARASFPVIEYPHIAPRAVRRDATVELSAFDLDLPANLRLGYVLGASDRVPGVLAEVGLAPTMLSAADLARGDLDAFDVIVVGSRAYETDAELGRANQRLVDFVRRGGTLVVQYQQYQFVDGAYAPAPLSIARPHGRVTDETAPVEVLVPGHRVFAWPNRIGPEDWQGWVQERGLYFASEWDELFSPLLALADPGREPERGALLVAELGEGTYVYTGLSFFRQLPAGVAGAIRLFVNLVSLEEDR